MTQPLAFVNYSPDTDSARANRRIVSTHIGKYHRNRSKPSGPRSNKASNVEHQRKTVPVKPLNRLEQITDDLETNALTDAQSQVIALTTNARYTPPPQNINIQIAPHRLDPFQTSAVPMTPQMEPVFMYYFNTIMPVVEPALKERDEYQQWLVPLAMSEAALFYALVGCMAHDIEQTSATAFGALTRRPMYVERSQYKLRATRALNECLSDPVRAVKPSTMMAVHFLLWQEIFMGDEFVQLDDVQRLLDFRGGFTGIQRKAIEAITVGSFWRAIRTRTRPKLSKIIDERRMSLERLDEVVEHSDSTVSTLGQGLLQPEISQHFDKEICQLFNDARLVWICFEQIGIYNFTTSEKRSITIQRMNIDHRLLSYPFEHRMSSRPIQEACRQALILYSNAHYNVIQPSSKIARCLVEDLQNAIKATDLSSCWDDSSTALLWALFLGAHMSFGQQERPWFVAMLSRTAKKCGVGSWTDVRRSLLSYYYSDRVFELPFRAVWTEVEVISPLLSNWLDI